MVLSLVHQDVVGRLVCLSVDYLVEVYDFQVIDFAIIVQFILVVKTYGNFVVFTITRVANVALEHVVEWLIYEPGILRVV